MSALIDTDRHSLRANSVGANEPVAASAGQVSVIIAAYNSAGTIKRAIKSALAQRETAEVLVVDDASTDDTVSRAQQADDGSGRLKILTQTSNQGPSAARNRALRTACAPWIAILDADDFFLLGRLQSLLKYADQADFIADNLLQVDEEALDGEGQPLLEDLEPPRFVDFQEFVLANISGGKRERAEYGILKPLIRRSFLADRGIAYREDMRLGEDYELYTHALALGGKFLLVSSEQKYVSVIRAMSLSGSHTEHDLRQLRDCDNDLAETPGLRPEDKAILRKHQLSIECRLQLRLFIEAWKIGNLRGAARCFAHPLPVPLYLVTMTARQILSRFWRPFKHTVLGRPSPNKPADAR